MTYCSFCEENDVSNAVDALINSLSLSPKDKVKRDFERQGITGVGVHHTLGPLPTPSAPASRTAATPAASQPVLSAAPSVPLQRRSCLTENHPPRRHIDRVDQPRALLAHAEARHTLLSARSNSSAALAQAEACAEAAEARLAAI
ncbi:hypothetical protein FRC09_018233 [Ceratobasidium sp. 395]|nr:hypothetical protein FRC09_018233 [Ceratobasidium sp. 395]